VALTIFSKRNLKIDYQSRKANVTILDIQLKENVQQGRRNLAEHYFKYDDNNFTEGWIFY